MHMRWSRCRQLKHIPGCVQRLCFISQITLTPQQKCAGVCVFSTSLAQRTLEHRIYQHPELSKQARAALGVFEAHCLAPNQYIVFCTLLLTAPPPQLQTHKQISVFVHPELFCLYLINHNTRAVRQIRTKLSHQNHNPSAPSFSCIKRVEMSGVRACTCVRAQINKRETDVCRIRLLPRSKWIRAIGVDMRGGG